jgi:hypothetical protein
MATRNTLHAPTPSHIGAEGAARQESVKCAGSAGRRAAALSASSPTRRKRMTDRLVPVPFLERPNQSSVRLNMSAYMSARADRYQQRAADASFLCKVQRKVHRGPWRTRTLSALPPENLVLVGCGEISFRWNATLTPRRSRARSRPRAVPSSFSRSQGRLPIRARNGTRRLDLLHFCDYCCSIAEFPRTRPPSSPSGGSS